MVSRLLAFVKRGWLTTVSYKMAFCLSLLGLVVSVVQFAFLSRFLGEGREIPLLQAYDNNLMAYLIIGTTFGSFVGLALNSFQSSIRNEQQMGTLEIMLSCNTSALASTLLSSVWGFLYSMITTSLVFLLMVWLFGMSMSPNIGGALLVFVLSITCLSGIGLMSAGVVMVIKQGDPITWVFGTLSGLASGILFPVELLPSWLRTVSQFLPTTYAISALRKVLILGASVEAITSELYALALFALMTIPLGIVVFRAGYNAARVRGSLLEY